MGKSILIVDDEADVLSVLEKRLAHAGFQVFKASNGEDAIAAVKKEHPDLILLDIMMPGMDGGEVAARLKDDPATAHIPVIFLTCLFTKEEESQEGNKVAHGVFVAKPYNFDGLLEQIEKQLNL